MSDLNITFLAVDPLYQRLGLGIRVLSELINKAKKYGDLIIGLYTDKAIVQKKRLPLISFENRLYSVLILPSVSPTL